jgi:hypothetical protein
MTSVDELSARLRALTPQLTEEELYVLRYVADDRHDSTNRKEAMERLFESSDTSRAVLNTFFDLRFALHGLGSDKPLRAHQSDTDNES